MVSLEGAEEEEHGGESDGGLVDAGIEDGVEGLEAVPEEEEAEELGQGQGQGLRQGQAPGQAQGAEQGQGQDSRQELLKGQGRGTGDPAVRPPKPGQAPVVPGSRVAAEKLTPAAVAESVAEAGGGVTVSTVALPPLHPPSLSGTQGTRAPSSSSIPPLEFDDSYEEEEDERGALERRRSSASRLGCGLLPQLGSFGRRSLSRRSSAASSSVGGAQPPGAVAAQGDPHQRSGAATAGPAGRDWSVGSVSGGRGRSLGERIRDTFGL